MENKNIIFCSCKPSQKTTLRLMKVNWLVWKERVDVLGELQDKISKGRKVNKLWQNIFDQQIVKLKNYACLREREP